MNTILMSGAEFGSAAEINSTLPVTTNQKRSGSYSYRPNYTSLYYVVLPSDETELVIGFGYWFGANPANIPGQIFGLYKGSTAIACIGNDASGYLYVASGWGSTPKYFTGTQILRSSTWYYIELYFKLSDTVGAIELRVDGISQGTYSGDTKPGADTTVDKIRFHNNGPDYSYLDDIMVNTIDPDLSGSWPNGAKIVLLKPSSDGTTKQWTPSAGSDHYALVDEVPPSATDYLQSTTAGELEELGLMNLPAEALSIAAVQPVMVGFKGSTSTPTQVKVGLRLSGTNYMSSAKNLLLTRGYVSEILNDNPATSNPFTPSIVNEAQLVLESAS